MYFLSWNLISRETCQGLFTRECEYIKREKENQRGKVLAPIAEPMNFSPCPGDPPTMSLDVSTQPGAASPSICPAWPIALASLGTSCPASPMPFLSLQTPLWVVDVPPHRGNRGPLLMLFHAVSEADFLNSSISKPMSRVILTAIIIAEAPSFLFKGWLNLLNHMTWDGGYFPFQKTT